MTSIATYVVVVVVPLLVVYIAFCALVRGVPKGTGYEVEVKLFPPSIRRRVDASDTRPSDQDAVPSSAQFGNKQAEVGMSVNVNPVRHDTHKAHGTVVE